jgi:hypothetical protein
MTRARVCLFAGMTGIAAMLAADASAQECPAWFKWACPDSASSSTAATAPPNSSAPIGRRTKPAGAAASATAAPEQTQAPGSTRPSKATRHTRSGNSSGERRLALNPALSDQEKEALFQRFVEWKKAQRVNAESSR